MKAYVWESQQLRAIASGCSTRCPIIGSLPWYLRAVPLCTIAWQIFTHLQELIPGSGKMSHSVASHVNI